MTELTAQTALSRRRFLQALAAASTLPLWARLVEPARAAGPNGHLLVVFLSGGNDGLNTLVPIRDSRYRALRPRTGLTSVETINLNNGYALNSALPNIHTRWRAGQVAVVQGVGSPVADFSHFSATEVWDTGSPDQRQHTGWLGRYLDGTPERNVGPVRAVALGDVMPQALVGAREPAVAIRTMDGFDFVDHTTYDAAARHEAFDIFAADSTTAGMRGRVMAAQRRAVSVIEPVRNVSSQNTADAGSAKTMAQLFASGLGTEIGFVTLGGFDTHSLQRGEHATRLGHLDALVGNFFAEAGRQGIASRSTVLVFSEFGRRVPENRSDGTDHGHGSVAFLIGPRIAGGLYGSPPDLSALVDGNLPAPVDLRSLYATVLGPLLGVDPAPILGGTYPTLSVVR